MRLGQEDTEARSPRSRALLLAAAATLLLGLLAGSPAPAQGIEMPDRATLGRMAVFLAILIAYAAAFMTLGYLPSTLAVFVAGLWLFGERRPLVLILVPVAVTAVVYLGFTRFLNVWLP